MKLMELEMAYIECESVYHAHLHRLRKEGRRENTLRDFVPAGIFPAGLTKVHLLTLLLP